MIVCVVGAGAREHALARALARHASVYVAPGNPGMNETPAGGAPIRCVAEDPEDLAADLYVIGPEVPLVAGLADRLRQAGRLVLGPGADGARLEGSKAYMKTLARRAGVPTADFEIFGDFEAARKYLRARRPPYVIKTDGLAAGKGVLVTNDLAEAEADLQAKLSGTAFGDAGRRVVIEDALVGEEFSYFVLLDGTRAHALPIAQDYKRLLDGGRGPNTGGMGAYSPVPFATGALGEQVREQIIAPTLRALAEDGVDYRGVLYAGCMLTESGPALIEFNVRFGDPEAQVIVPLLSGDLAATFAAAAAGALSEPVVADAKASVVVVLAAAGYPGVVRQGDRIHGLDKAGTVEGVTILHGATTRDERGDLRSAGGRVLCVQALGDDLGHARRRAYEAVGAIDFDGMQYRSDIAADASSEKDAR